MCCIVLKYSYLCVVNVKIEKTKMEYQQLNVHYLRLTHDFKKLSYEY
jgi:hypothetical protein